jgi:hypothetical protein
MKNYVLGASFVAGVSMIAAPATAQATGFIGGSYGNIEVDDGTTSVDGDLLGLEGSVAVPLSGLYFQADASLNQISDDTADSNVVFGAAHLGVRNAQWAAAGFIGVSSNEDADSTGIYYGGEFAYYLPQFTIAGGIGLGNFDDTDVDLTAYAAEGRFFATDNFRIDAHGGVGTLDLGGIVEVDTTNLGIGAEWKPDNFPISLYAAYDVNSIDDADLDISTISVGIRFDFGNGTLKLRDRNGPTFRSLGGLEGFGRIF